ncbi:MULTISPECIES: hypothetical protein [Methylosinus]|uniref:Uncharacterized protein n=1 Tax=Methylosinus sporium TaxID=428 RepID=A0A2U1SP63_METSR|nr:MULTISPECIES: hypothetical protein [Methylosinus]MBU3889234.1 hypothetical protein [Methylosinus sp. KRF6]PWB93394.1 hypothetical protein C5689_13275 [Methylosinus sporium]TRL36638.1 hypothetical protein FM996_04125 [Methylosinus sporium]
MDNVSRGVQGAWRDLSHFLPARARMRPTLRRKAQSLVHRGDLSPDCIVTSIFETGEAVMCVTQFAVGGAHQTVIAPLGQLAFDRAGPLSKEIDLLRARLSRDPAAVRRPAEIC